MTRRLSADSRTKKASLNAAAAGLDVLARVVVGLMLQPLLVGGLGDQLYGVWKVLARMTGYVSAAGGRPAQALKWTIATHQSSSDFEEKRRRVATAIVVWLLYLPVLTLVGGLAAWFLPIALSLPSELTWTVRVAAALLVARTVLANVVTIPRAVMRGENMEYKRMGLSTVMVFVGGGLMALAVLSNTGLVGVATAYLATMLLTGALFFCIARSHVSWFGLAKPSSEAIRRFFAFSWWLLIWQFLSRVILTGDVIVLGVLGSLELVTVYALTKHVPELLFDSIAMAIGAVMPGMGGIIGGGKYDKGARLRGEFMLLTWLCFTTFGATVLLWNQDFVGLWVGSEYAGDPLTTLLIIIMVVQFVMIRTDAQIIDLTLNVRKKTIMASVCAAVCLILSGALVAHFGAGIIGLCVGFIIGRLILSISYPFMVGNVLGISPVSQLRSSVRPGLTTLGLFAAAWILNEWIVVRSWFELVAYSGITAGMVFIAAVALGLSTEQRECLSQRFKKLVEPAMAR